MYKLGLQCLAVALALHSAPLLASGAFNPGGRGAPSEAYVQGQSIVTSKSVKFCESCGKLNRKTAAAIIKAIDGSASDPAFADLSSKY